MVFPNSGAMVSDGFDLEKDLQMRIILTDPILRERCVLFRIQITLLLVSYSCNSTVKYSVFFKILSWLLCLLDFQYTLLLPP